MRHFCLILLSVLALTMSVSVVAVQAHAQDDDQGAQVSIVEPPFQSPQQWTYGPGTLEVPAGTVVTWTNTGVVAHTVTADDNASFDSGSMDAQATFTITTETPGTYAYHCRFHPWMTGTLTVTS